jgi:hypothetical protein
MLYPILLVLEIFLARLVVTTRVGLVWTSAHTRLVTEYALQDWFFNGIGIGYKNWYKARKTSRVVTTRARTRTWLVSSFVLWRKTFDHCTSHLVTSVLATSVDTRVDTRCSRIYQTRRKLVFSIDKFRGGSLLLRSSLFLQFQNIN